MEATSTPLSAAAHAVTCRHCQKANPTARRFCGGCGKSLWESCPQCGAENAADERFCGSCGGDIHAQLSAKVNQHQAALSEAQALAERHDYEAAIAVLATVTEVTDPRFEQLATDARGEVLRLEKLHRAGLTVAAQALEHARAAFATQSYEQAQSALEQVPEPLRGDELTLLLDRARACRNEVLTLSGEIRQAALGKRFGELLPKLDRLLALKPNHAQARQLAEQLRDKLFKVAAERMAQQKYQEAFDQLSRIPEIVRTPEVVALLEQAAELNCLVQEAQSAALADRQLVKLTERLCKLAPGNVAIEKLAARVKQKCQAAPVHPRFCAANWAPTPQRTLLGVPVDWLAFPTRVPTASDAVSQTIREHPGQFFIALGLALQGLEQTDWNFDLLPRDRGSLLSKLPSLNLGKRPPTTAWGLDISDTSLKAIKLVRDGKEGALKIEAAEFILHQRPLHQPGAEQQRGALLDETLAAFVSRAGDLKTAKIATNIAGSRVLGRFFDLPPMHARKVGECVQYEARHQLPIELEALCWSHVVQDEVAGRAADEQPRRVLVQATRDTYVRERLITLKNAGLAADVVQNESLALHFALVQELDWPADEATSANAAIAAIDVGVDSTNVVVSSPRSVWFRTFGVGGDNFTRELNKALQLTADQAELIKRDPARAERYSLVAQAWQPLFVQFASEVERSLTTYRKLFPDHPIQHLYGLGGGFPVQGLLRYLRTGK